MDKLRVVFLPQWYSNPYQKLLDENLTALGVRMGRFKQDLGSIIRGLIRIRPQVLHLHWLHAFYQTSKNRPSWARLIFSLCGLALMRLLGTRIVWTAHNLGHHEAQGRRIDRLCTAIVARRADAIIVHGESAKLRLIDDFNLPDRGQISVIPHGHYIGCYRDTIDRGQARDRLNLPAEGCVFLFFGQIRPYKGVLELIEAYQAAGTSESHLVIAGKLLEDEAADALRKAVEGVPNLTFAPGFVADDRVQEYMKASDVVVLPYREALTSGAALLAMSFGKACAAPQLPCFTEVLDDRGAFLYHPESPDGLAGALRTAIACGDRLEEMGAHNRALAERLDWMSIAQRTLTVYGRTRPPR